MSAFAAASSVYFHDHITVDSFFGFALLGALVVHFCVAPSGRDALAVSAAALALALVDSRCNAQQWQPMAGASCLGLGSLVVLGLRALWDEAGPASLSRAFWAATLFPAMAWLAGHGLALSIGLHPKTWDLALYSFDCSLGMQISFAVGRWFVRWGWLQWLCKWVYYALPLPMALVFASHLKRNDTQSQARLALAFLLAGPAGWLLYNLLPGTGPVFVFPDFPRVPFATADVAGLVIAPIPVAGQRNAIPSMHLAWILLAWWNSRSGPAWVRWLVGGFVVFTIPATLGFGQHYFIDLVVAVPFAVMVQALASLRPGRTNRAAWTALVAGLAGTLAWLALIRFHTGLMWKTPALPWTLMIATTAGYLGLERKLAASLRRKADFP